MVVLGGLKFLMGEAPLYVTLVWWVTTVVTLSLTQSVFKIVL